MKRCLLLLFLVSLAGGVSAQNNHFFGHYMFNPSYFNPSWGGNDQEGFVALQHRTQWLGYQTSFDGSGGAPSTQMVTAIVPIQGFVLSSIGLNISNDDLGPINNFQVQLPISYSKKFRSGKISLGVSPSLFTQTLNTNQYRPNDPTDPILQNLSGSESQSRFDLSAGLFFASDRGWYVGASVLNILQPGFSFGLEDSLENIQAINYTVHGGINLNVRDGLIITPTFLVRSDLNGFTFDFGAIATLNNKLWAGVSYRRKESAILYLGYSLLQENKLKVGYSFDYIVNDRQGKSATSHEIFIRYDLPNLVLGGRKSVKTPRFSF